MKMSLIDMVQDILSDMDSDDVGGIDESVEAAQVAQIIKSTYNSIMAERDWPHLRKTILGESVSDSSKPTHLKLTKDVTDISTVFYDCTKFGETKLDIKKVDYLEPDEFMLYCTRRNTDNDNTRTVQDFSGARIIVLDDHYPKYYTSFDDFHLVFDAFDSEVESTLQGDKMQTVAYVVPSWTHEDDFIPDMPDNLFPYLLSEAKGTCMARLKQMNDFDARRTSKKQETFLSKNGRKVQGHFKKANYGRRK